MGEIVCSFCGQRLLSDVKICPSCGNSTLETIKKKQEKDNLINSINVSQDEATYEFSDEQYKGFFIGRIDLSKDRWLRIRGEDIFVYDKGGNILIKDKIESFCLLWNEIRREKNDDLHISIIIDHIALKGIDHIQIALNKSETSSEIFELVSFFSSKVCDNMQKRIQKSFWKAIKYSMPEKKGEKKHKFSLFPTGKGSIY